MQRAAVLERKAGLITLRQLWPDTGQIDTPTRSRLADRVADFRDHRGKAPVEQGVARASLGPITPSVPPGSPQSGRWCH